MDLTTYFIFLSIDEFVGNVLMSSRKRQDQQTEG